MLHGNGIVADDFSGSNTAESDVATDRVAETSKSGAATEFGNFTRPTGNRRFSICYPCAIDGNALVEIAFYTDTAFGNDPTDQRRDAKEQ